MDKQTFIDSWIAYIPVKQYDDFTRELDKLINNTLLDEQLRISKITEDKIDNLRIEIYNLINKPFK